MRLAPFSKDSDDLSVTNSMEENCQKLGAKCSSRDNLGQNNLHSKTEDGTLEYESQQEDSRDRKVNYEQ